MRTKEIMTNDPACCTPEDTIGRAAQLMEENDCGCIPVVQSSKDNCIVGVITDRDIAVRGVGHGRSTETPVREVMTASPYCCSSESGLDEVERVMSERQVRRVVIVDDGGCCVGIVAQADLALAAERADVSEEEVAHVVERISEPAARVDRHM